MELSIQLVSVVSFLVLFQAFNIGSVQATVYYVKPDSCSANCSCPQSSSQPNCLTLSEYTQIGIGSLSKFVLNQIGEYYLDNDLVVNGSILGSLTMTGNDLETAVVKCRQKASLSVDSLASVSFQNVAFESCGSEASPGLILTNVVRVELSNVRISRTIYGGLYISHSSIVKLTNLSVSDNYISVETISMIQDVTDQLSLIGLTMIVNNSIKALNCTNQYEDFRVANKTPKVFLIKDCTMSSENLLVANNIGPYGVVAVSNTQINVVGNWLFEQNSACLNGSLSLSSMKPLTFTGTLSFLKNRGLSETDESTSGLFLADVDSIIVNGTLELVGNEGYLSSLQSINSNILIFGSLHLMENWKGFQAISLTSQSSLTIENGSLIVTNNTLHRRTILIQNSQLNVSGLAYFFGNTQSPIAVFNGKIILRDQILFEQNAGVMYTSSSDVDINGNSCFMHNDIEDDYKDGALAMLDTKLSLRGVYNFIKNVYDDENGGAIYASSNSNIRLGGVGVFSNNRGNNGGAMFVDQLSSIYLEKGVRLHFQENRAVKGAAIFIGTSVKHTQCNSELFECLFEVEDENDVSLAFRDNQGDPGASILHVNFDHIEMTDPTFPALNRINQSINNNQMNSVPMFSSDSFWLCFCTNNSREDCAPNDPPQNVSAIRGKPFTVKVRALKFYEDNRPEPLRYRLKSALEAVNRNVPVSTSLSSTNGNLQSADAEECQEVIFSVRSSASEEIILMNIGESNLDEEKTLKVNVELSDSCPDGFPLNSKNDSCECDNRIRDYLTSCEITDTTFQKRIEYQNYWIGPTTDPSYQGALIWFPNCPFGYCKTNDNFTFTNDSICTIKRSGVLCGMCQNGTSLFLGGDKCGDCPNNSYLALLIVFAALGILLVAFIFLTQMTVAAGTINGIIFYANMLQSNQSVFFSEGFFRGYIVFISWLNLNFGIETCFYKGMDQATYTGLQFVFPVYLWLLVGLIITLCRFSNRISKLFGNSDPVAVLATIILLSYNSLVQNTISIFFYASLNNPDNSTTRVWRYNGNINYATGPHVTLIIVALVFLGLFFIPYTLTLLSAQILQKSDWISKILRRLWLQPFIHVYLVPFKPAHRYWVGLCLMMRAVLLAIFVFAEDPNLNLFAIITSCVIALSTFRITGGIYDKNWVDILEISFLVNLAVLSAATAFASAVNGHNEYATYVSITVAIVTFTGITAWHIFHQLKKLHLFKGDIKGVKIKLYYHKKSSQGKPHEQVIEIDDGNGTTNNNNEVVYRNPVELREPLLESQN